MELISCYPLFLLGLLSVSLAYVEPPTNVTLRCHNLHNILEWDYGILLPDIRFKVTIQPYSGSALVFWVDPQELQLDISSLSDSSNSYYLEVIAVVGQNESEPAPRNGITFSYFQDSLTRQKCSLDLPPVNVTTEPYDHVLYRFFHPWLWHHQMLSNNPNPKSRQKKSNDAPTKNQLPQFDYTVLVGSQKKQHRYSCVKSVCEKKIPVDDTQEKHCLNITGEVDRMAVKSTQLYCAMPLMPPEQNSYIVYIVIIMLILTTVLLVIVLVYKKKTRASTPFPTSMSIKPKLPDTVGPSQDEFAVPTLEPSSPTPLLSPHSKEDEFTLTVTPTAEPDFRGRIGLSGEGEDVRDDVEEGHLNDDRHEYMEGGNLDEDGTQNSSDVSSGYEKREVLVDMGEDELAEGYRTRNL
ncbi:interferon gamma receptor 1 [Seriola dumerili]|uniref:Interferon gamma receptor 1 n=1 Tax=Seriola dumerili TaxID=41447 RepID=A0A3B4V5N6_SERDU|nr:interferon gamma receptor 1 [Seriola dumerili]